MSKRDEFVERAIEWIGTKEGSKGHKQIVSDYNKACDAGRQATMSTPWCAVFVGAVAEETDNVLKDGIGVPVDNSCGTGPHSLLEKAKKAGIWIETDSYVPRMGDMVIFDWKDKGTPPEDITGHDHVGIVTSVGSKSFKTTEGNKKNAVGTRTTNFNGQYIRGFIAPKFSDEVGPTPTPTPTPTTTTYKVKTNTGVALRLRSEPNTNSKVLASMPNGSIVDVDSTENGWAHVVSYTPPKESTIYKSGYASMTYLKKV